MTIEDASILFVTAAAILGAPVGALLSAVRELRRRGRSVELRMRDESPRHRGRDGRSAEHNPQRGLRQITERRLAGELRDDDFLGRSPSW